MRAIKQPILVGRGAELPDPVRSALLRLGSEMMREDKDGAA